MRIDWAIYLSRKTLHMFFVMVLLSIFLLLINPMPAKAGTFDGIYDYRYNLRGPNGWENHEVSSGFIVENGRISSDPPALSGTVDSNGNVQFTGPSPYGQGHGTAVFTGVIRSDGTGSGTYQDSTELTGSWSVTRVSGGGGFDIAEMIWTIISFFSPIGELLGFSGGTAAAVGVVAVVVPIVVIGSIAQTRSAMKKQKTEDRRIMERQGGKTPQKLGYHRELGYKASQPGLLPTPQIQEPPPPIDSSSAQPIGGVGVHQDVPSLPSTLNLHATWGKGQVELNWNPPQFDRSMYQLEEYVISRMQYQPSSTAPQKVQITQLSPEYTQWRGDFHQTYKWNTSGDIEGYTVDAIFRHTSSISHEESIRIGNTVYAPHT